MRNFLKERWSQSRHLYSLRFSFFVSSTFNDPYHCMYLTKHKEIVFAQIPSQKHARLRKSSSIFQRSPAFAGKISIILARSHKRRFTEGIIHYSCLPLQLPSTVPSLILLVRTIIYDMSLNLYSYLSYLFRKISAVIPFITEIFHKMCSKCPFCVKSHFSVNLIPGENWKVDRIRAILKVLVANSQKYFCSEELMY